jgi:Fe-S cluster assembly protein SufD
MGKYDDVKKWYLDAAASFERDASAPNGALKRMREAGARRFAELDFPTTKHEDWKYTSVKPATERRFAWRAPGERSELPDAAKEAFFDDDCYRIVFADGAYVADASIPASEKDGAYVARLKTAITERPEAVERALFDFEEEENVFAALGAAFAADGAFVHIPKNASLEKPVHIVHYADPEDEPFLAPTLLVAAEENSSATIVESFLGADGKPYLVGANARFAAATGARLTHVKIQQEGDEAIHLSAARAKTAKDATFETFLASFGGKLARNDVVVRAEESGGFARVNGVVALDGERHVDNRILLDHAAPHCKSSQLFRAALNGNSRSVFNGKVLVRPDSQKIDAFQQNDAMLLSDKARSDSKPQLEIFADDVKCSHGATTGQLDKEALFYLRSRGLSEPHAKRMLVDAFTASAVAELPLASVRERIEKLAALSASR